MTHDKLELPQQEKLEPAPPPQERECETTTAKGRTWCHTHETFHEAQEREDYKIKGAVENQDSDSDYSVRFNPAPAPQERGMRSDHPLQKVRSAL